MNNKKTMKTILFASLIAAMVISISEMPFAQAEELSQEKIDKLLEKTYNISVLLEDAREKLAEGANVEKRVEKLEERFNANVEILNGYGYITTAQLEEDPNKYDQTIQADSPGATTMSCCNQILHVDTGYYNNTWWIFWDWVYSSGPGELNFPLDSDTITKTVESGHTKIKPGMRTQLEIAGSATYNYTYEYEGSIIESGVKSTTATSSPEITIFETRNNASTNDLISVAFTAVTLSP